MRASASARRACSITMAVVVALALGGGAVVANAADPPVSFVAKLTAADPHASDSLGSAIAISGDVLVVGATGDDGIASDSGAAYVYTRSSAGVWTQRQKLIPSDGTVNSRFGNSVTISGGTIVVGAYGDDGVATDAGAAYVFTCTPAGVWAEQSRSRAIPS
jgi:hypothetical protein